MLLSCTVSAFGLKVSVFKVMLMFLYSLYAAVGQLLYCCRVENLRESTLISETSQYSSHSSLVLNPIRDWLSSWFTRRGVLKYGTFIVSALLCIYSAKYNPDCCWMCVWGFKIRAKTTTTAVEKYHFFQSQDRSSFGLFTLWGSFLETEEVSATQH